MKIKFTTRGGKMKRSRQAAGANRGPKALAGSISDFCRVLAVSAITALGIGEAGAVTYYWDPGSTGTSLGGGGGDWDSAATASWWPGSGITTTWDNTGATDAVFGNTSGIVSVLNAVKVGSITFNSPDYSLAGNGSIEFSGGTRTITVTNPYDTATINTFLKGTGGFIKAGAGTLVLDRDSSGPGGITGGITIDGGTLVFDYTGASFARVVAISNGLTFSNSSVFRFKAGPFGTPRASMELATLTFQGGEGTVHAMAPQPTDDAVLTFSSLAARVPGATGVFVQDGPITATHRIVITGRAPGFIDQGIFFNGDNFSAIETKYAFYDAGGFVRGLNYGVDANTFTQGASMAGIAVPGPDVTPYRHVQVTGDIAGQGNLTLRTLNLSGSSFSPTGGIIQSAGTTLTLTNAGILKSGGGKATITGGTIAVGSNEIVIRADGPSDRLFINSVLTGTGGVTKSGKGSLFLNAQTSGALSFTGSGTSAGSATLELAASTPASQTVLVPGMAVNGPGIPANTTVLSVSGSTVTLSQAATATSPVPLSYSSPLDNTTVPILTAPVTLNITSAEAATLSIGMLVTGANIPANTTVTAITGTGAVTISNPVTASVPVQTITFGGSTVAFGTTQNFGVTAGTLNNDHATSTINSTTLNLFTPIPALVAGMSVDGPGIVTGTTIASVAGTTVTLSQVATADSATAFGAVNTYLAQVGNGSNTTVLSPGQASTLVNGSLVTGVNIPRGTTQTRAGTTVTFSTATPAQQIYPATYNGGVTTITLTPGQAAALFATNVANLSVAGTNIPTNTIIVAIDTNTGVVTLNQPTSGAAVAQNLIFGGSSNQNLTFGGASLSFGSRTIVLTPAQAATVVVGSTVSGPGILPDTTVTGIQDLGGYKVASLSKAITPEASSAFVTFGGSSIVGINSAYDGSTLVNAGIFAVSASGLPSGGIVKLAAGAEFAAVNSIILNNITITGADAVLSAAGSTAGGGFSGAINAGANNFELRAQDFTTTFASDLLISGAITGTGQMKLPNTSKGIVTLSGDNSAFTGSVTIESGATLSVARLNSLSFPVTNGYSAIVGGGSATITLSPDQAKSLVVGATVTGTNIQPNTTILSINNVTGAVTLSLPTTGSASPQNLTFFQRSGNRVDISGTGTLKLALDGNGGAAYASGGNGTGAPQNLALNSNIDLGGGGTIQPDRDGTAYGGYFRTAGNKTIQLNTLTLDSETLTIQVINPVTFLKSGSGVEFTGTTTMSAASTFNPLSATPNGTASGAASPTASNVVQGLTLSGLLTGGGTGAGQDTFIKTGSGTLVLGNANNNFGGNGSIIRIKGGVLSVGSNGALGDAANSIAIDWDSSGLSGVPSVLRATGNFTTARVIGLNSTNNNIEVTAGNTFTASSTFSLPVSFEANPLNKAENGTLVLTGNNSIANQAFPGTYADGDFVITLSLADALALSVNAIGRPVTGANIPALTTVLAVDTTSSLTQGFVTLSNSATGPSGASVTFAGARWDGRLTVNAGAVRVLLVLNGNALGSTVGGVTVARTGAALQISGGVDVADRLTLNGTGLNSAGALQGMGAFTNTASSQVILSSATTIGADAGSILNLTGGITGVSGVTLTLNSAGSINITTNALDRAYGFQGDLGSSTTVNNVTNIADLLIGMRITGLGIQANTTITGINTTNNSITITPAATQTVSGRSLSAQGNLNILKFGAGTATLGVNSPTFIGTITVNEGKLAIGGNGTGVAGITIGTPAAANNILIQSPSGVLEVNDNVGSPMVRMGGDILTATVANTNSITLATPAEAAGLVVGQPVFGTNIAAGTTISAILVNGSGVPTGAITLSAVATGPVGGASQIVNFGSNRNVVLTGGTLIYNGNAAGSTELFGTLSGFRSATNVVQSNMTSGGAVNLNFTSLTINGDSSMDFQGAGLGNGINKITFNTAPGLTPGTTGILQRATLNGIDFVSYNHTGSAANTNGIQAFTNYNINNNLDTAAATDTLSITAPPVFTVAVPKTINAFRISGNTTVSGPQGTTVTVTSGAILSSSGNNVVNLPVLAFGAQPFFAVATGSKLTVGSLLTGGGGFIKALPGLLELNAPDDRAGYANLSGQTLTGNFEVNAGELKLGGGNNTLTPNQFLIVGPGATLDLNGTYQFALGTRGDGGALQGNQGTITNRSITTPAALILGADNGSFNFGGVITQAGAQPTGFLKAGTFTYSFSNDNTYSGATVFAGGTNTLLDGGRLSATSSIAINYARLAFNDDATFALANRVNAAAPITMNGGSLAYTNGRQQTETIQTVGAVTLAQGQNFFQSLIPNAPGVASATLSLASLSRPVGSSATVRFADVNPANTALLNFGGLGTMGNAGRITFGTLNGVATATAVGANNNLIGAWAVVDREYASYIPTLGVGALSTTGFAGYSTNFLNRLVRNAGTNAVPVFNYPGENIRATLNIPGLVGDTTVNTLAVNTLTVNGNAALLIDLGGKKLTLAGGGLLLAENNTNAAFSQNITIRNGTITSGAPGVGGDLYLQTLNYGGVNNTFIIDAIIANNGAGPVRLVKASGAPDAAVDSATEDYLKLNGANTYTGGTVVNGGNLVLGSTGILPAGGITISGGEIAGVGAIFQDAGGVIHPANTVTLNGLGALTLTGDNTLAGLVFNNSGVGSAGGAPVAPTVTTFRADSAIGKGTLTLGGGGITSTPVNPVAVAIVTGRLDFGAAASTVTVNPYSFSTFTDFAPTTAGLILQGVIGSAGGITKAGGGVLQLNGQNVFTGPLTVTAGTVQIGIANAGSRFSQLNLSSATSRLNLNGLSTVLGSLAGSGIVTSTTGSPTLTVGFDNSSTIFSGQFSRFNDATPGAVTLIKIGSGTMTIASPQDATSGSSGGVTVNGGGLTYSAAGRAYVSTPLTPVTYNVNTSGTLTLDNTTTNIANRMGHGAAQGTLNLAGGTLVMIGNSTVGSDETMNTLNFGNGASTIRLIPGGGATTITITGSPNPAGVSTPTGQDSGLVTGVGLGTTGAGSVNVVVTGSFPVIGGGGGVGTQQIPIRPDLLGDATGGPGTGFLAKPDGTTNFLRPLNQTTELTDNMANAVALSNVGLTSPNNTTTNRIIAAQTINSLTLLDAGTPSITSGLGLSAGVYAANALPLTLTVTSGGFLALSNATIGIGAITSGGTTGYYHVVGEGTTMTLRGSIVSTTQGIVKADAGTLIFNAPQYYTGAVASNGTTVNGGTLRLNAGNNTILVQPTGSIPTLVSLYMNGGTLDLFGTNQIVERISNNNANAGTGGVIINSGVTPVTFTSAPASGANTIFAGSIGTGVLDNTNNAISFTKSGNSTLTLTNVNSYTGSTVLRGGGLTLQDSGTLATSGVTVNFGTLLLNEGGLNPAGANPVRIPTAAPITLNGGTLQQFSGGSLDSSATFNTVTLASGGSVITQSTVQSAGSSALINIGSLVQGSPSATVSFTSFTGTLPSGAPGGGVLGGGGLNNNQIQITNITPNGGASVASSSLLVNGMLPAWITVNGSDFAGYLPTGVKGSQGIGAIGSANFPAYSTVAVQTFATVAPTAAQVFAYANATDNLSANATMLPVTGRLVGSVAIRNPGGGTVIPVNLPTDTLSIRSGGLLINSGQSVNIQGGRITAGSVANGGPTHAPSVLYATTNGGGAMTINSQIVDNGNQTYSANTDGISNVVTVSSTVGLVPGQLVTGPGMPIFGASASTTANSANISVGSVAGILVGMPVTGNGLPSGEYVTAVGPGLQITVSSAANITTQLSTNLIFNGSTITGITSPTTFTIAGNTTAASFNVTEIKRANATTTTGSATITVSGGVGAGQALAVGMYVSGPGIPAGTTVTALGAVGTPNTITISNPATQTMSQESYFAAVGGPPATNNTFNLQPTQAQTLVVGMTVSGNTIPTNTTITAIDTATGKITVNQPIPTALTTQLLSFGTTLNFARYGTYVAMPANLNNASGNTTSVGVNNITGLATGMTVSGPGIPAGTVITGFGGATQNVPNSTTVFLQAPVGQVFSTTSRNGINLVFGTGLSVGDSTTGAVALVKTGTGALTLTPQLVMNGSLNSTTTILVPTVEGLVNGMTVSGSGIPAGSTITIASANSFTIGSAATATQGAQLSFGPGTSGINVANSAFSNSYTGGTFVNQGTLNLAGFTGARVIPGDLTINNATVSTLVTTVSGTTGNGFNAFTVASASGLSLGMAVIGNGIPANVFVTAINTNPVTVSATTVASNNTFTVTSASGLAIGMAVSGPGIPANEFVTAISGNNVTITTGTGVGGGTNNLTFSGNAITVTTGTGIIGGTNNLSFGNPGQIVSTGNVTLNGGGAFNLFGANTLGSITINNIGGITAPTVALGTGGTLTLTNGISVTNDSFSTTPTINGTNSTLVLANSTIATSGASPDSLLVTVPITPGTTAGTLTKTGTGSLILAPSFAVTGTTVAASNQITVVNPAGLSVGMAVTGTGLPANEVITAISGNLVTITTGTGVTAGTNSLTFTGNTFTGGVNLTQGSIILGANSTPISGTVTSGPLGTGALNMADGTALLSDGTLRTIANAVTIAANATFGPLPGGGVALAGNGVTLAGPVTLTSGVPHTITVPDLQNVTNISGTLSGGNNLVLTKAGSGMLQLSNTGTYTGTTTINVTGGVLQLRSASAVPVGMNLSVAQGAVYDINGNANQVLATLTNPTPNTPEAGGLVTNSGGAVSLFVGGTSTTDVTSGLGVTSIFDGVLTAANTANLALNKVGRSTLVLTGANLYTGNTSVTAGQLTVNGSLANTAVSVLGGGSLGGTGMIGNALGGSVTLTGNASPSLAGAVNLVNGSIGALSLTTSTSGAGNALIVGGGTSGQLSIFNFDIGSATTDRIDLTSGAKMLVNAGGATVNLTQLSGSPLANGNYNLITYSSASGTPNVFFGGTVTGGAGGANFASNNYTLTQTSSSLVLTVGGVPLLFFWKGNLDATWSTGGTTNWVKDAIGGPAANTVPNPTAIVNFNATGAASFTTTLGTDFTIDQLIFNSTSTSPVTIGGSHTLTLNNNLNMQAGTAAVTISTTNGTTGLVLGGTQSWILASANNLTVNSPVSGSAPLTITSSSTGRVILNGNNAGFTGGLTIAGNGTNTAVQLGSATALGPVAGPNPLVVNIGALDMNGQSATISSLSSTANTGIIKNSLSATTSTLSVIQSGTTSYSGVFQDSGSGKVALVVDGGGFLQLLAPVGTNFSTYSGGTIIGTTPLGGTLRLGNNGNQPVSSGVTNGPLGIGPVTINGGGTLNFSPGSSTTTFFIQNSFVLNGGQILSSGGNQRLANSGTGVLGTITVNAPSSLTPSPTVSNDLFVDGKLTGSGSLTVGGTGLGKVILTNNLNDYTGTLTSTSAGNLQLLGAAGVSNVLRTADLFLATNANGLSFGSTITSVELGSLGGGGNFALQNTAGTPAAVALTVGSKGTTTTYGGVMSSGTVNGSLTKTGSGTMTLSGLNTYRGTTTVTGSGALRVNNNNTTLSVTGLGNVLVTGTATLGGNGVIQGGNNTAPGVVTLNSGTFLDPGFAAGSFGTLRIGVQTAAVQPTTLTLANGSTFRVDVAAGAGSQDRVTVVGSIAIGTSANLVINATAPDQGKYTLLSATVGISNSFTQPANVTGIPTGYSLVFTGNTIDLQRFSTIGSISTPALLEVIKGASVPFGVTVANSAPTGSSDLSFTASAGLNTSGSVSPAVVVGAQSSGTGNGLSFSTTSVTVGPGRPGNFTVSASGATNSPSQPGTVIVNVYDHADYGTFNGGTLNMQPVRVGYVGPVTSSNFLSVQNIVSYGVNLKGSAPGAIGNISLNNLTDITTGLPTVAAGSTGRITASLASTQPEGFFSQPFTYSLGDDSTLNGSNNGARGTVIINVTGNVYNGQGVWAATPTSGSWGTFANWTMPGGYPGLDGPASINDTATFGSTVTGPITLDGVSPLINSLTFNSTSAIIAQGIGSGSVTLRTNQNVLAPTITVTGGTPSVSAPMVFSNTVIVTTTNPLDQFTASGSITGAGGVTKNGPGTIFLTGTNAYLGKTTVNAGTLSASNSAALGAVPSPLPVADQITLNNGAKLAFTGNATLAANQGITVGPGNATLDVAPTRTLTVTGALSGTGTLTKTGTGTLDIQSSIQGAFILANNGGTFAPTVGAAAFLLAGDVTFNGGTFAIDVLGNPGSGGQGNPGGYDFLTAGAVTINAPTNLTINLGFIPNPATFDAFTFIHDGSANPSGTFNSYFTAYGQDTGVVGAFDINTNHVGKLFQGPGGHWFQIDYAGGTGSDIVLLAAVPEPGSVALLLGGVGLLGLMRRRRPRNIPFGA